VERRYAVRLRLCCLDVPFLFCGSAAWMCGMASPFRLTGSLLLAAAPLLSRKKRQCRNHCRNEKNSANAEMKMAAQQSVRQMQG